MITQPSWRIADTCDDASFHSFQGLHPVVAQVMFNRGVRTASEASAFLSPDYRAHTHDPYHMEDMRKAVERIISALRTQEQVTIYGDYDVDGLSATTLLFDLFSLLGIRVNVHINHRERDGYGLQLSAIEMLAEKGTKLIITTDCGISNAQEIARAHELGMEVIITDHHAVPAKADDIPPAYAILHPLVRADRYPFKFLSGGGVAFKLVQAIIHADFDADFIRHRQSLRSQDNLPIHWEAYEKWLLDLVAMSTVGDCMPLVGENRVFVTYGLVVLAKTKRIGLKALIANVQSRIKEFTPFTIGFLIGPRINAASRMDHAQIAFDLLNARDDVTATALAADLEQKNTERQKLTEKICKEAKEQLNSKFEQGKKVLIGSAEHWPIGMLGLVAGKLCNLYHRPVVLMTHGHGGIAGAARSVAYFDITKAFSEVPEFFSRFGGHKAAGGFALKDENMITQFTESFEVVAERHFAAGDAHHPTMEIDVHVSLSDISEDLAQLLKSLEPHGQGNAKPLFLITGVSVIDARTVGATNKHLKLTVQQNGLIRKLIGFGLGERVDELLCGTRIDCVIEIDEHEWNGTTDVQLTIKDFHVMHTEVAQK
ncbi:MAG: single-stranded-DNA-specific exonuclease RecJ [bacterium]|nr:single-stranded-DNA-specific exonuclease RecJ [bacterium]